MGTDRLRLTGPRRLAAGAGLLAALAGIGLGAAGLFGAGRPAPGPADTFQHITTPSPPLPLSAPEIIELLDRRPDLGALQDPRRRASCLAGLGYPASTRVLGARPVTTDARSAVLLVLPGEQAGTVIALAVSPTCSSADTGLLGDTLIRRPQPPREQSGLP